MIEKNKKEIKKERERQSEKIYICKYRIRTCAKIQNSAQRGAQTDRYQDRVINRKRKVFEREMVRNRGKRMRPVQGESES